MNKTMLFLFLFAGTLLNAQLKEYYQQHAKYKMDIEVDAPNFTYKGKQSISYTNNSPDELNVVYFHLYWNAFKPNSIMDHRVRSQGDDADRRLMERTAAGPVSRLQNILPEEEGAQNIKWIRQNGKNLRFEVQETIMKVFLAEPLAPNSTTNFTMEWDAVIPKQIRRSGRNNSEGIDMTMTQWYPKIAEYDYDGWATFDYVGREFHAPFSDYEVNIQIDKDYVIGAGGTLLNPNEVKGYSPNFEPAKNKVIWRWTAKNILDFAWAADRDYIVDSFTVVDGPKVFLVYQPGEKTAYWEASKPYISKFFQLMNATFGRYIYPSYSFVQGGDGGMEYGMTTMILGEARSLEGLVGLMVHEGAHSWYQQMLASNESTKPWIDEGFTSYAESYVMYRLFPPGKAVPNPFVNSIKSYVNFTKTGKEEPASWLADHHDNGSAYSVASYTKGELFLVQLGYIMGEENLLRSLKEFYSKWVLKHPTDRDFLHIAQKTSGMDLKWFHHYWINTTKTIDYAVKEVKYGKNSTEITLTNLGGVPMPVDFSVLTKDRKTRNFHIPLNMMRTPKLNDFYGQFEILPYWNWSVADYTFTVPFGKEDILALGIDFSERMADVAPENNFVEVK